MKRPGSGAGVIGIAAAKPTTIRTNDWWNDSLLTQRAETNKRDPIAVVDEDAREQYDPEVLANFERHVGDPFRGAEKRHILGDEAPPSSLEIEAARSALANAGRSPSDIDLLIVYSQRPDWVVPKNHALIAQALELPASTYTMEAGADFASLLVQIGIASDLVAYGSYRNALVIYSHAVTALFEPTTLAGAIVGDSAVAAVIGSTDKGLGTVGKKQLSRGDLHAMLRLTARSSPTTPWYSEDARGASMRAMDAGAARVAGGRSMSLCREACMSLLAECGYEAGDVRLFACGEPAIWFARTAAESMGIPADRVPSTFKESGRALNDGLNLIKAAPKLNKGDLVLMYAPSPGFLQSALLMRWAV